MDRFLELLNGFDVFFVGIHCPLGELERRERERGNRPIGDAKRDFETTHGFCMYDFEVDSTKDAVENAKQVIDAWERRDGNTPSFVCETMHPTDRYRSKIEGR